MADVHGGPSVWVLGGFEQIVVLWEVGCHGAGLVQTSSRDDPPGGTAERNPPVGQLRATLTNTDESATLHRCQI